MIGLASTSSRVDYGRLSMGIQVLLPQDFNDHLPIANGQERLDEAFRMARKMQAAGVPLLPNPDHAAIFCDPPYRVAGPLKQLGYVSGWDARCYPSPVDEHDYINARRPFRPTVPPAPRAGSTCGRRAPGRRGGSSPHDESGLREPLHPSHHLGYRTSGRKPVRPAGVRHSNHLLYNRHARPDRRSLERRAWHPDHRPARGGPRRQPLQPPVGRGDRFDGLPTRFRSNPCRAAVFCSSSSFSPEADRGGDAS